MGFRKKYQRRYIAGETIVISLSKHIADKINTSSLKKAHLGVKNGDKVEAGLRLKLKLNKESARIMNRPKADFDSKLSSILSLPR